jgi:arabinan endo-1,5-alpha-L-arabinosidase
MVVYSNNSSNFNAIDPDIFFDASGNLWMTYGSWNTGIKMQQLNTSTGKPLNSTLYSVCTFTDAENSQIVRNGSYYYLFVNRGLCCKGTSSTYYIQVGRATSPTGPYSSWRTVLSSNSNFIGPGAIGYYNDNGVELATYHYYDGSFNGAPTLAIGKYTWSGGWPSITLNWLSNGTYRITNVNSGLSWDDWGCTGASGQAIAQGTWNNLLCQKWDLTVLGNGYYKITCGQGGLSADAIGCSDAWGTKLDLYAYWGGQCQQFHVERTNTGSYVLSQPHSANGNYTPVVEVPGASTTAGVQLALWGYNGNNCQKWNFVSAVKSAAIGDFNEAVQENGQIILYPSPASSILNIDGVKAGCAYKIFSITGSLVKQGTIVACSIDILALTPGLYYLTILDTDKSTTLRFVKE